MKLEKYDKKNEFSYAFGLFPTFEMLKKCQSVEAVLVSSKLKPSQDTEKLFSLCKQRGIEVVQDDKTINRISDKENTFVVGVFKKIEVEAAVASKNVVLASPSDMGNLGTIMRTMLGFGIKNLVMIRPCVDVFNPKVIRSSMGAVFSLKIAMFNSVQEYLSASSNSKFFFMLDGAEKLGSFAFPSDNFDLVFGNEGSGLPEFLKEHGRSVVISHSNEIDSLNLPISVGISLYECAKTGR